MYKKRIQDIIILIYTITIYLQFILSYNILIAYKHPYVSKVAFDLLNCLIFLLIGFFLYDFP